MLTSILYKPSRLLSWPSGHLAGPYCIGVAHTAGQNSLEILRMVEFEKRTLSIHVDDLVAIANLIATQ